MIHSKVRVRSLFKGFLLGAACLFLADGMSAAISEASPFLPSQETLAAKEPQVELQVSGLTSIGDKSWACIEDTARKKSRWLAVGTTVDGIELVSCDLSKSEVVVQSAGKRLVLTLRKASTQKGPAVVAGGGAVGTDVGPAGGKLPPIVPLTTKEEQEREARMLVSDLLEIGMRQRKAYEEAQRKTAAEAAK